MSFPQNAKVIRGETHLLVPHYDRFVTFVHPAAGPGHYIAVGKEIFSRKSPNGKPHAVPTADHTASLVFAACFDEKVEREPEFVSVREVMRKGWLLTFNLNLWTPRGVYVVQDSKTMGTGVPLDPALLDTALRGGGEVRGVRFSKDGVVRFAPADAIRLGAHTPESLAGDGFILASFGEEGTLKLSEASRRFRDGPFVWGINDPKGRLQTTTALSDRDEGSRLFILSNILGDAQSSKTCYAFGMVQRVAR